MQVFSRCLFYSRVFFLSLLVLQTQAFASWSEASRDLEAQYSHPFHDAFEASIWRAANTPWLGTSQIKNWKELYYLDLRLGAAFQREEPSSQEQPGKLKRAPLMVILPGIFSSFKTYETLRTVQRFEKRGYHVLALSNPWSGKWIAYRHDSTPGNIYKEAQISCELIQEFVNRYQKHIESVNVFGLSYGAFLSAMLGTKCGVVNGEITLVAPPFDLDHSLKKLDRLADENFELISTVGSLMWKAAAFMNRKSPSEMPYWDKKYNAGVAVYAGFVEDLSNSVLTYTYAHNIDHYEPPGLTDEQRKRWLRSFRFKKYVQEFLPEFDAIEKSGDTQFLKWVKAARHEDKKVRILTSNDDFLNERGDWDPELLEHGKDLMVLPEGGHMGFLGLEWFDQLMDVSF